MIHSKNIFTAFTLCISITHICCSSNNTPPVEALPEAEKGSAMKSGLPTQNNSIIGKWKLMLEAVDENNNKTLDDAERKKAKPNTYYYDFRPDGSCIIFQTQKGHYEIQEKGGEKKLTTFIDEGMEEGLEAMYIIKSVGNDEMILLEAMGELTFWIFKRV